MHFEMIYDRRSYHWQKSLLREETQRFFTQVYSDGKKSYNFCEQCYKENEYLFFKLLHNTKDPAEYQISPNNTIYKLKGESEQTFSQILQDILKQKKTVQKEKIFLEHPVIAELWYGQQTNISFYDS